MRYIGIHVLNPGNLSDAVCQEFYIYIKLAFNLTMKNPRDFTLVRHSSRCKHCTMILIHDHGLHLLFDKLLLKTRSRHTR